MSLNQVIGVFNLAHKNMYAQFFTPLLKIWVTILMGPRLMLAIILIGILYVILYHKTTAMGINFLVGSIVMLMVKRLSLKLLMGQH